MTPGVVVGADVVAIVAVVVAVIAVAVVVVVPPAEVLQVVAPLVVDLGVLAVVLLVVGARPKACHHQLVALPLNVAVSLLLRMSEPLASNVQATGMLAESSIYSPIISRQRSIRARFIITTVHTPFYRRRMLLTLAGPPLARFP